MKSQFAIIDGVKTPRPKGQDIKPKKFPLQPHTMIMQLEPTERRVLWMIQQYPYFMNVFFTSDICRSINDQGHPNSPLSKYMYATAVLQSKGYIKHNWNRLKYRVTLKGHFFRLTTHPAFPTISLSLTALGMILRWLRLI